MNLEMKKRIMSFVISNLLWLLLGLHLENGLFLNYSPNKIQNGRRRIGCERIQMVVRL